MKSICSKLMLGGAAAALAFSASQAIAADAAKPATKVVYEAGCDPEFAASYPLFPKLMEIPANQPKLLMEYPFRGENNKYHVYNMRVRYTATAGKKTLTKETLLNRTSQFWVDLSGMPEGLGNLKIEILSDKDSSVLNTTEYTYKIVSPENIYGFEGKELNSLVSELVNQPLASSDFASDLLRKLGLSQSNKATFSNFREGWVYLSVVGNGKVPAVTLTLDGKTIALESNEKASCMEAFRKLPAGRYTVQVSGDTADATLIVRNVPMLFSYPLCCNSPIAGNPPFDYDFHKKYIFPASTSFCGGLVPEDHKAEFLASGREVFVNVGGTIEKFQAGDQQKLNEYITDHEKIKDPLFSGVTIDELFMYPDRYKALDALSKYLKDVKFPDNKPAYTWIVGSPDARGVVARAIAAMVNATEGRGMMLLESYNAPKYSNKTAAENVLKQDIIRQMQAYSRAWSGADNYLAVIFGNFTQGPLYRVDTDPAVDYKYFLDMQFNLLANSPVMHHVAGIGYWGNYYADEENLRWSFELMRHYCVEGKTTMLSDEYGYTFNLPYVINPDFTGSLNGWTVKPAKDGKIELYKNDNLASWQFRWRSKHPYAAAMTRSDKAPNLLTQKVQKLIPGKLYTFQVFAMDPDGTREQASAGDYLNIPFRADIDGVEIVKSYRYAARNNTNCQYVIFRAKDKTATITLSDWKDDKTSFGPAGQRTIFNYVKINPYFSANEEENKLR